MRNTWGVPTVVHQIKDPALTQLPSRSQPHLACDVVPGPGASICRGCSKKKKKRKKKARMQSFLEDSTEFFHSVGNPSWSIKNRGWTDFQFFFLIVIFIMKYFTHKTIVMNLYPQSAFRIETLHVELKHTEHPLLIVFLSSPTGHHNYKSGDHSCNLYLSISAKCICP